MSRASAWRKLAAAHRAAADAIEELAAEEGVPVKRAPVRLVAAPEPTNNPKAADLAARALARKRSA